METIIVKPKNAQQAKEVMNVLKKMNALKKEKRQEAELRQKEEATANTLRTDKRKLEQEVAELKKNTTTLVKQYRDLHELSVKLRDEAKEAAPEAKLSDVPELDTTLLEAIEQDEESKKADSKKKKTA